MNKLIFTAMSKKNFFQKWRVVKFILNKEMVPLNPFMLFDYFMADSVDHDLVRKANHKTIEKCDELWVFGETIADGVLFEALYARRQNKPVGFFTVDSRAEFIKEASVEQLEFEPEVYSSTGLNRKELINKIDKYQNVELIRLVL